MADAEHSPAPQMSRGIYGFVLFNTMSLIIIAYFVWMLAPTEWYKELIYEPPQAYWGLAVPVYFCTTLFLFAFCIYPAMHSRQDCELDEPSATTDSFSLPPNYFTELKTTERKKHKDSSSKSSNSTKKKFTPTHKRQKSRSWSGVGKIDLKAELKKFKEEEKKVIYEEQPIMPVSDLYLDDVCRLLYLDSEDDYVD